MKLLYKPKSDWHKRDDMTPGRVYKCDYVDGPVYSSDGIYYSVVNDKGLRIEIHENHLVDLNKIRNDKLNDLGI
jgi:hypothetical protein